jgi:hypothetical protein
VIAEWNMNEGEEAEVRRSIHTTRPLGGWVAVLPYYNVFVMGLKGLEAENRVGLEAWMPCGGIGGGCMAPG